MDKFDRIFQLHSILRARRTAISCEDLTAKLECSKATLYRAISTLKDTLNAPIVFDAKVGGYLYSDEHQNGTFELPGLWFTPNELQALVVIQRLLNELGEGMLEEHFAPFTRRINELTRHKRLNLGEASARIRMPAIAACATGAAFQNVISATLRRRKLWIEYFARSSAEVTDLGEMQTLATGVGDLKRVLSNVKTRGTWAEVQLGAATPSATASPMSCANHRRRVQCCRKVSVRC